MKKKKIMTILTVLSACLVAVVIQSCSNNERMKSVKKNNVTVRVPAPEDMVFINDDKIIKKALAAMSNFSLIEEMIIDHSLSSAKKNLNEKSPVTILAACSSPEVNKLLTKKNSNFKATDLLSLKHRNLGFILDITDIFDKSLLQTINQGSLSKYIDELSQGKKNSLYQTGPNYIIQVKQGSFGSQTTLMGRVFYRERVYALIYFSLAPGKNKTDEIISQGANWIKEFAVLNQK